MNEELVSKNDLLTVNENGLKVAKINAAEHRTGVQNVLGQLAGMLDLTSVVAGMKKGTQFVVQVPTHLQVGLDSGKYSMMQGKTGQTWATIVEKLPNGKNNIIANCPIKEEALYRGNPIQDLSQSLCNIQMQSQMAALAQKVEETYDAIIRVEKGQQADRRGQLAAGRNGIIHALKMKDPENRKISIANARQSLLEAQGKIGEVLKDRVFDFEPIPRMSIGRCFKKNLRDGGYFLDKQDDKYDDMNCCFVHYLRATQLVAESYAVCDEMESAESVFDECRRFLCGLDYEKVRTILYSHKSMKREELFCENIIESVARERKSCLETIKAYDLIEIAVEREELLEVTGNVR